MIKTTACSKRRKDFYRYASKSIIWELRRSPRFKGNRPFQDILTANLVPVTTVQSQRIQTIIYNIFGLGNISGIPVINELATIEVLSFEVKFARSDRGIKFISLTTKVRNSLLELGEVIKLEDINLSFT